MMNNKTVYFIGIKGTGMASLAKICHNLGYTVLGSDIDRHFFTEDSLKELNIPILSFDANNIKDDYIVVIGNAFTNDNVEVKAAKENSNIERYSYHDFLGKMMNDYRTITVSGSHGKTTTTTLLHDMLSYSQKAGTLIGDGRGFLDLDDTYFSVEACEYRRHFLSYHPNIAIMTNFEIDHVDYFKDERDYLSAFEEFSKNVSELLIVYGDDEHLERMHLSGNIITYGFTSGNDIYVKNMDKMHDSTAFDVYYKDQKIHRFNLPIVGDHMVLNSLAVIAVGIYEGITVEQMEMGLRNFKGALRRFVIEEGKENIYIDDYAHHPTEIDVTLKAAKTRYPDRKIVAIFKGHRVGRLHYFQDQFASSLGQADEVCLMPFTSIDDYEEGIDMDIDDLQTMIPGSHLIDLDEQSLDLLQSFGPAVYVFMSSKDIYDLRDALKLRYND
ncbi:UDP-N-acetylmuramate--L-alanine ligase [Erysipelothrix urinaevulpis]|uniref:UDP-N-acetylmuramate--L-alanine ligase n=1 Tax=Erysipelothrix urinaevulpis TaxID=2683717 RepID=UPI00135B227E|nr:Mur ligase family protein [Erysipelothrix urinaevulpis]